MPDASRWRLLPEPVRTLPADLVAVVVASGRAYRLCGVIPADWSLPAYLTLSLQAFVALIFGGVPKVD